MDGASPHTPLRELTALLRPPSWWGDPLPQVSAQSRLLELRSSALRVSPFPWTPNDVVDELAPTVTQFITEIRP